MSTRRNRIRMSAIIVAGTVVCYLGLIGVQAQHGRSVRAAAAFAVLPLILFSAGTILMARSMFGSWMPSRRRQRLQQVLWAAMIGSTAAILLGNGRVAIAVLLGVAAGLIGWFGYDRTVDKATALGTRSLRSASTLEQIEGLLEASRRQLRESGMTPGHLMMVQSNLARSLTDLQGVRDDPKGLLEAAQILTDLLGDCALGPSHRVFLTAELSATKSMLASVSGVDDGWPQALEQQLQAALQLPPGRLRDSALMRACDDQAQLHLFHLSRMWRGPDGRMPANWDRRLDAAIECVRRALDVGPPGTEFRAHLVMELGVYTAMRDQDAGLVLIEEAFQQTRRRPLSRRQDIQLALAMHLADRGRLGFGGTEADRDQAGADLERAERLALELVEGSELLAGPAAEILSQITGFREEQSR